MQNENMTIISRKQVTEIELAEIKQLAKICNQHEGFDLKLNYNLLANRNGEHPEDFLYYLDEQLIGYSAVFCFNLEEAELSGMVHPDYRRKGIFSTLCNLAIEACKEREIPKLLFICEEKSASGKGFVHSLGAEYSFSEYVMYLQAASEPYQIHPLTLREATTEDAEALIRLNVRGFEMKEESAGEMTERQSADRSRKTYIALLHGETIGKITTLDEGENNAFISGFVVDPDHQGKGYGRHILNETVDQLRADHFTQIGLEVAVKNKNALKLYESCGFVITSAIDYYMIPLT